MKRKKFLELAGGTILVTGGLTYLLTDNTGFARKDIPSVAGGKLPSLDRDEEEILYLASLAPSGHNTQPWFIKRLAPFHWVVCNDSSRWLPAIDPAQRETVLSIGAFAQNLEYAAAHYGYNCQWQLLAGSNQDEDMIDVKLLKTTAGPGDDVRQIGLRRTVRSGYLSEILKKEDLARLTAGEEEYVHYIPRDTGESRWLGEQTIEANRRQLYRNAAQEELSNWIRFSNKEAARYCDGLTPASMEIEGLSGWVVRNFYDKSSVMGNGFRERGLDTVKQQVDRLAGWLLITSRDNSTSELLDAGRRLQRLLLRIRDRNIAIHPMTQILEEPPFSLAVNRSMGVTAPLQFVLRCGYIKHYPDPVSLRRPVSWFVKSPEMA